MIIIAVAVPNGPDESSHLRHDRQSQPDPNEARGAGDEGAPALPLGVDGTGGRPYRRLLITTTTIVCARMIVPMCHLPGGLRMIGAAAAAAALGGRHPPRPSDAPGGRYPGRGAGGQGGRVAAVRPHGRLATLGQINKA